MHFQICCILKKSCIFLHSHMLHSSCIYVLHSRAFWTCCILQLLHSHAFHMHSVSAAFWVCCILLHSKARVHYDAFNYRCILRRVAFACILVHAKIQHRIWPSWHMMHSWLVAFLYILMHSSLVAFSTCCIHLHSLLYAFNKCCIPLTCCILWLVAYKCIYVHVPTGCILETYMHQNASECTRM